MALPCCTIKPVCSFPHGGTGYAAFTPEAMLPTPVYSYSTYQESLVTHPFWLRLPTIEASTSGSSVFICCILTCNFLTESALLKRSPPAYYFASSSEWFTNAVRQRQWEAFSHLYCTLAGHTQRVLCQAADTSRKSIFVPMPPGTKPRRWWQLKNNLQLWIKQYLHY